MVIHIEGIAIFERIALALERIADSLETTDEAEQELNGEE